MEMSPEEEFRMVVVIFFGVEALIAISDYKCKKDTLIPYRHKFFPSYLQ